MTDFRKAHDALNEAIYRLPPAMQGKIEAALLVLAEADARERNELPKIDAHSWNAALEAAAKLLEDGFLFVDRGRGVAEILARDADPEGDYIEARRCGGIDSGGDADVRAILSLKR